jgi:hypothetical protein
MCQHQQVITTLYTCVSIFIIIFEGFPVSSLGPTVTPLVLPRQQVTKHFHEYHVYVSLHVITGVCKVLQLKAIIEMLKMKSIRFCVLYQVEV